MAKYEVTMKCGHVEEVSLVGKTSERDRKIAWMERDCICTACKEAQHQEENAKAAAEAEAAHLPQLEGSEKQVAWATTIRQSKVTGLNELLTIVAEKNPSRLEEANNLITGLLQAKTSASYWIDNKDETAKTIVNTYARDNK